MRFSLFHLDLFYDSNHLFFICFDSCKDADSIDWLRPWMEIQKAPFTQAYNFPSIFHFCNVKALLCCTASFFLVSLFICANLCSRRGNKNEIKICWTLQIPKICATFYFTNKFSYKIFLIKLQRVFLLSLFFLFFLLLFLLCLYFFHMNSHCLLLQYSLFVYA